MVTAAEKKEKNSVTPAQRQQIKALFKEGLNGLEVAQRTGLKHGTVLYWSPKNIKRRNMAKVRAMRGQPGRKAKAAEVGSAIQAKIDELKAERDALNIKIEALESVL